MPPPAPAQPHALDQLRARIAALEGAGEERTAGAMPLGLAEMDAVLPWGGLPLGCLHDIAAAGAEDMDSGPPLGFAALLLGRLAGFRRKPVLWVAQRQDLYAPALAALSLPADRLVVAHPRRPAQALWAMEEGLRCAGLAAVLGEVERMDFTAARRLQLAARSSGVTALLLNHGPGIGTAVTQWRLAPAPGGNAAFDRPPDEGVGPRRWQVTLWRCRGRGVGEEGFVAGWLVEWNDETRRLRVVAPSGDRSAGKEGRQAAG